MSEVFIEADLDTAGKLLRVLVDKGRPAWRLPAENDPGGVIVGTDAEGLSLATVMYQKWFGGSPLVVQPPRATRGHTTPVLRADQPGPRQDEFGALLASMGAERAAASYPAPPPAGPVTRHLIAVHRHEAGLAARLVVNAGEVFVANPAEPFVMLVTQRGLEAVAAGGLAVGLLKPDLDDAGAAECLEVGDYLYGPGNREVSW
jgi:hypothetical protein